MYWALTSALVIHGNIISVTFTLGLTLKYMQEGLLVKVL